MSGRLAYALAGTAGLTELDRGTFDFRIEIERALDRIGGDVRTWFDYVNRLRTELHRPLTETRASMTALDGSDAVTYIFLGGFFGKYIKTAHIRFEHGPTESGSSLSIDPPGANPYWGSIAVRNAILKGDAQFSKYSNPRWEKIICLDDAVERVKNDVLAQYDPEARKIDSETCSRIGGRLQVATITLSDGFAWVSVTWTSWLRQ